MDIITAHIMGTDDTDFFTIKNITSANYNLVVKDRRNELSQQLTTLTGNTLSYETLLQNIQSIRLSDDRTHISIHVDDKPIASSASATSVNTPAPLTAISEKHQLKEKLKSEIKHKFKVGDHYMLRTKSKCGSPCIRRIYQIKQLIWSMNNESIQALVVKQLSGPNTNMMTLSMHDCHHLHVKYEPGLQVLSMKLNWIKIKNYNEKIHTSAQSR